MRDSKNVGTRPSRDGRPFATRGRQNGTAGLRETLVRVRQRCVLIEELVGSDTLKLAKAERELRATREALEELSALPDMRDPRSGLEASQACAGVPAR